MRPTTETLRVTWKIIRRPYKCCRTPKTYCSYIIENENHKHRKKTFEDTELFKLLATTRVHKDSDYETIYVDCMYAGEKLISISNPRKR
jgi:hypothetical protein